MKILRAVFAVAAAALLCCGCSGTPKPAESVPVTPSDVKAETSVSLAFCNNDRFNPYTALTAVNRELCALVFEPLVDVDYENYEAVNILAANVENEDKSVTVTLRDGVLFSDGTPLTADDVVYSFTLAKKKAYIYSSELDEISSCSSVDGSTVKFTLSVSDPFADHLLTFPIIKSGSDAVKNSDSIELDPIGTGRYVREDKTLVENVRFRDGGSTRLKRIGLVETPDTESVERNVTAGRISVYYSDMSDEKVPQMIGKIINVRLNNLVFVGINNIGENGVPEEIRRAVSMAADRTEMVKLAYSGMAVPASGPFPAVWKHTDVFQTIFLTADKDNTLAKLNDLGYNKVGGDGYRRNSAGNTVSLELLVNADSIRKSAAAELLSEQLKSVGIKLNVVKVNYETLRQRLETGKFQMYLGEIRLKPNMDLGEFLCKGGSAAFGVGTASKSEDDGESVQEIIGRIKDGRGEMSELLIEFMSELPVIPLCHRYGRLCYLPDIPDGVLKPFVRNIYNGIWLVG